MTAWLSELLFSPVRRGVPRTRMLLLPGPRWVGGCPELLMPLCRGPGAHSPAAGVEISPVLLSEAIWSCSWSAGCENAAVRGCVSFLRLPSQSTTIRVVSRNRFPTVLGGGSRKSRCQQGRFPLNVLGKDPSCLFQLVVLRRCLVSLGITPISVSVVIWHFPVCFCVQISSLWKGTGHIGLGPTLIQSDPNLLDYI